MCGSARVLGGVALKKIEFNLPDWDFINMPLTDKNNFAEKRIENITH